MAIGDPIKEGTDSMATVREKTIVQTRLNGDGIGHARTDVHSRDLLSTIDEPIERGGTNNGFSPTETALAALIGCTNVIGHKCADKLGVAIGHLKISLVCDFDRRGVTLQEEIGPDFKSRCRVKILTIARIVAEITKRIERLDKQPVAAEG